MSAITSNLAEFVMKPTFVIIIVLLAVHFGLRRASAATRHLTLTLALVSLLVLPFLSLSLPVWELEILPASSTLAAKSGTPSPARPVADLGPPGGMSVPVRPQTATLPATRGSEVTTRGSTAGGVWTTLVAVWLLGSVLLLAKVVAGLLRMRWIVRQGTTLNDPGLRELLDDCRAALNLRVRARLVSSEQIGVPLVWGWLRPTLIVPREFLGWTLDRKRAVMLHELAHLKRSDWPILLLGRIMASLYWFHPLAWYLERCAKRECERACDDLVVNCGTKPSDYASHLLSIARGCPETPEGAIVALAVVRRSHLNSRVRSILDPLLRRGAPSRRTATVLSIALVVALLPFASVQLAERAQADEPSDQEQESDKSIFDGLHKVFHDQHSKMLAQHSKVMERLHGHAESDSEGARFFEEGYSLHGAGRYNEAIEAFERAIALDYRAATAMYNIGCCHALLGQAGGAMSWLEKAQDAGMDDPEMLTSDSDFDPIRSDAGFQGFIDESFEAAGIERRPDEHYPYRAILEQFEELQSSDSTDGKLWYKIGTRLIGFGELDRFLPIPEEEHDLQIDLVFHFLEDGSKRFFRIDDSIIERRRPLRSR